MADSNIAGLPAGAAITNTDLIAGSDAGSGTLVKKTGLQFNTYIQDKLSNLPTTDPHILGMLWNNGGLVAISQPFTRALAGNTGSYAVSGHAATIVATTWAGPTWSPTDHSQYVGISGTNNEVATRISAVGGQSANARSDTAQTTGSRFVEITVTFQQSFTAIGLGTGAATYNETIGYVSADTVAYTSDGHTLRNGSFVDIMPTYGTGDVIGMIIDLDGNTISYSKNGGSVLATDDISALRPSSDPIFIMVSLLDDSTSNSVTIVNI